MSALIWQGPYDNVYVFSFSGTPGVGKSTAVTGLDETDFLQEELEALYSCDEKKELVVLTVHEPSALWRDKGYLQAFYEDPKKNALAFQMIVFDTHVDAVQAAIYPYKDRKDVTLVVLVERSMWDQLLFWKLQIDLKRNKDDILDDAAYMGIWNKWNLYLPPVRKIFYCKTSHIQKTMKRIQNRARREEMGISQSGQSIPNDLLPQPQAAGGGEEPIIESVGGLSLTYMTALREKHDAWYTEPHAQLQTSSSQHILCKHIDMDLPYHNDVMHLRELAKLLAGEIVGFLN